MPLAGPISVPRPVPAAPGPQAPVPGPVVGALQPVPVTDGLRPVIGVPGIADDEPEELAGADGPTRRTGRSYTWLHLIVLALVAFVLGCVIILLLDRPATGPTGSAAQPSGVQLVPGTASSAL